MAELVFFSGTMDCGKSTLALQLDHNHAAARPGRGALHPRRPRRARRALLAPRAAAPGRRGRPTPPTSGTTSSSGAARGERVDYLVCDEAQFYTPAQVEQLAQLVDEMGIDVYAFGITADFRTRLFPGSARLVELADRVEVLQVQSLCWCGARATHNARTVNGAMVVEGDQVVVGDTGGRDVIGYEVLCRRHHMRRMTAAVARATNEQPDTLPFVVS